MRFASGCVLCVLLAGCDQPVASTAADLDSVARLDIVEGSAPALGLLSFLNDASTTVTLLDIDVALDVRAARSIIHYRNGADKVFGTADDQLFTSVAEVDDQWYVGDSALTKMIEWAHEHGWVALEGDDLLGTWDGVSFTVAEAEAVLGLANSAASGTLDDEVGLDRRAVESILDARPVESIEHLAGLYYVGGTALVRLKDFSAK